MERQGDLWDAAEYASSPSLCIHADSRIRYRDSLQSRVGNKAE